MPGLRYSFNAAVEGTVDEIVLRRILEEQDCHADRVFGRGGKPRLRERIMAYNSAARHRPWIVLVDLDYDAPCAAQLRRDWIPQPSKLMCFRVAVRETESWLLADHERMAKFLGVPVAKIPAQPDRIEKPKRMVVDLARQSRRTEIRRAFVPRPGSGRELGPEYGSRLIEYVLRHWRPRVAAERSDSLRRCLDAVARFSQTC